MTEPHAGADPTEFTCRAELDGDEWVINGEKWFSSNTRYASFLIVMVVTDPEAPAHKRISAIIVPKDTPGVNIVRNAVGAEAEGPRLYPVRKRPGTQGEPTRRARTGFCRCADDWVEDEFTTRCGPWHRSKSFRHDVQRALSRRTKGEVLADKQIH